MTLLIRFCRSRALALPAFVLPALVLHFLAAGLLGMGLALPVRAADSDTAPYWVSLRNSQTNMRVGPGRDYRINWTYVRPGLPLKVLRTMEGWVLVEDPDGARGWMLTQFVSRRARTALVRGDVIAIRENRDGSGRLLWRAQPGVIARLLGECSAGWCKVDIDGRQGYAPAAALWGTGAP
jgi:SH3-like domain-containing protein